MREFLSLAFRPDIMRRAFVYAVVVGGILILINHGDYLIAGEVDVRRGFKLLLTPLVPYCVSTLSSVGALRSQETAE